MILHLPTISRWIRTVIYMVLITGTLWKLTNFLGPFLLPTDPYRIPAGDALSVHAKITDEASDLTPTQSSPTWNSLSEDLTQRLKVFLLIGE